MQVHTTLNLPLNLFDKVQHFWKKNRKIMGYSQKIQKENVA